MRGFPYSLSCPLFRFTARNDLRVCRWLLCFALLTGPWFSMRINDEKRGVNALRRESQVSRLLTFFCLCSARPLCSFGPPPPLLWKDGRSIYLHTSRVLALNARKAAYLLFFPRKSHQSLLLLETLNGGAKEINAFCIRTDLSPLASTIFAPFILIFFFVAAS